MDWFIAFAIALSLGGAVTAPMGAILFKGYKDERRRLESGGNPHALPRTEQVYQVEDSPKKHHSPSNR